jgi:3-hydroxybutyryl-CoA dehydrogenase
MRTASNRWWDDLGRPHLDAATTQRLVAGLSGEDIDELVAKRDSALAAVIAATHVDRSAGD